MTHIEPTNPGGLEFKAHLELSSNVGFLSVVRSTVEALTIELGWSPEVAMSIKLAIDEALTNKIRHAYDSRPDGQIQIDIMTVRKGLVFQLSDQGKAPDMRRLCARKKLSTEPGGLGTHIIRDVMDEVVYESVGVNNLLIMTKYFPASFPYPETAGEGNP